MSPTPVSTVDSAPARSAIRARVGGSLQQLLAFVSLIVIMVFFTIVSPYFLTPSNLIGILMAATVTGILALGTTFVIVSGGIDLSIGTGMIFCGVMTGVFLTYWGWPVWLGVIAAVLFGGLIGFVNGFNVAVLGLSLVISGTKPIYFKEHPDFQLLMNQSVIPGSRFPLGVLIFIVLTVVAAVILSKTIIGRYAYSIGSNEAATSLSGVNVVKWKLGIYTMAGLFVGIAGVLAASRLSSAQPVGGQGLELEAIAAVVIGGTSLQGGRGSIVGTVVGSLIVAVLTNGLRVTEVPQEWQSVAVGCVILVAVYVDMLRRKGA
jgi:ribose transport system permease protein